MIKADEMKGPSCLTAAAPNEPIFVLRANDELAPGIVRLWASRYMVTKAVALTPAQEAKYHEAMALANAMERWNATNG